MDLLIDNPAKAVMSTEEKGKSEEYTQFFPLRLFLPNSTDLVINYICTLCGGVYHHPVVDRCDHIFCKDCITIYFLKNTQCPFTQEKVKDLNIISIPLIENIINKETIRCKNRNLGCLFEGKAGDYQNHLENICPKEKTQCPNEGCSVKISRESLNDHLSLCIYRKTKCEYCGKEMIFNQMKEHLNLCPKIYIQCPKCNSQIKRNNVENHLAYECEETDTKCSYEKFGCSRSGPKKEIQNHLNQCHEYHNQLLLKYIKSLEEAFGKRMDDMEHKMERKLFEVTGRLKVMECNFDRSIFLSKKRRIKRPFNSKYRTYNGIFDIPNEYQNLFIVNENRIKYFKQRYFEHMFVFLNINLVEEKRWEIKIKDKIKWFSCGVCDKNQIFENDLKFTSDGQSSHGTFLISSNGCQWNCNNAKEEKLNPMKEKEFSPNDTINFLYNPKSKELLYSYKNNKGKLTNVCSKGYSKFSVFNDLVPCLVFLYSDVEIEVKYLN